MDRKFRFVRVIEKERVWKLLFRNRYQSKGPQNSAIHDPQIAEQGTFPQKSVVSHNK